MRVVITGSHFSPALSVIVRLMRSSEVLLIGRKHVFEADASLSFDYRVCRDIGIPFKTIRTGRLQRKITQYTLPSLFKFPIGVIDSIRILRMYKPDVVVSFGGYISVPVAIGATMLGIPVVIHEQVQRAGLANRVMSRFATKICISFQSSQEFFPKEKTILTGLPLRDEIFKVDRQIGVPKEYPILYVAGGSSGSHFINEKVGEILGRLLKRFIIIHQTGDSEVYDDFAKLEKIRDGLLPQEKERYIIRKFIVPSEIGWVYKKASVVLSRAGINTVCELLALFKPSLLIPLPYGQKGEQLDNAKLLKNLGIGTYLLQKDVTSSLLSEEIENLYTHRKKYSGDRKKISKIVFADATQKICDVIQLVYEEKTKGRKKT